MDSQTTDARSVDEIMPRPMASQATGVGSVDDDDQLLVELRNGVERAFVTLAERHHTHLVRAATKYVRDSATAEDVVQETWVAFLDSLDRFEKRCSIKTWLFRILFNKAQTRVKTDRRQIPFSSIASEETASIWNSVDPSYFRDADDPVEPGHWSSQPPAWKTDPEEIARRSEALDTVNRAIDELPPAQGTVIILRDINGLTSKEVCAALEITAANQRVLLHRARTTVRRALSGRYGDGI